MLGIASVRLSRILRTSSFRLTLFYAGIFCGSFIALFGVIYWSTAAYMNRQIDTSVSDEITELQTTGAGLDLLHFATIVTEFSNRSPGFFYLLQDVDGRRLAGNFPPIETPAPGLYEPSQRESSKDGRAVRGRGILLKGGVYLFIGRSTHELNEMQEFIRHAFEWGFATTILIALAGGAIISQSVLGRVESLSRVSREIMTGDLLRRIEVRGSNDEFDHLATSLNNMLDRIQTLMEGLRQVSNDIAHELRTPLTRLRQRVELATRKPMDTEALSTVLNSTLKDIDAVLETFNALLRIAQIESSSRRASFTSVDLTEVLETVVEVYLSMAEDKGQTIAKAIPPGLSVRGDRELLMQLFANLVENAVRHTPAKTRIEISATPTLDHVDVRISDTGDGIPAPMRPHVFTRFFRLEKSRTTPGNGLGLSLVAAIAALHHSTIDLSDNKPGLCALVRLKRIAMSDAVGNRALRLSTD
ncbi:MAG: HAMP domain-containing protein [Proteobacteria bacterium]|nr:HAMP domain-containing protein [Pseudomonadota bacterium]